MKPTILVVDDEPDICSSVKDILEDEGYTVITAENGNRARQIVRQRQPDMILLDIWMPDIDGITLLKEFFADMGLQIPVVMMSGHGTVETAVEATRLGAKDYIEKPLSLAKLLHTVENALAAAPSKGKQSQPQYSAPLGKSAQMQQLRERLEQAASFDTTVLLIGEPGSGKTFCAQYLHGHGKRRNGPFMDIHSRTFRDAGGAALLLGREDANGVTPGLLDQCRGGTLFIDDIAELDPGLQESLSAVLTTRQWVRLGGSAVQDLDLRFIAGTRHRLEQEVHAGRFREDLYHLLSVAPIHIPPLREHAEDVTELLQYYVNLLGDREGLPYRSFSVAAQNRLRHYHWPGNIRQLENLVRRLLVAGLESQIELDEVEAILSTQQESQEPPATDFELPLRQAREQFEKAYLEYHLRQADWSVGKVAKQVGMERTHLYRKLKSLGIDTRRDKQSQS